MFYLALHELQLEEPVQTGLSSVPFSRLDYSFPTMGSHLTKIFQGHPPHTITFQEKFRLPEMHSRLLIACSLPLSSASSVTVSFYLCSHFPKLPGLKLLISALGLPLLTHRLLYKAEPGQTHHLSLDLVLAQEEMESVAEAVDP